MIFKEKVAVKDLYFLIFVIAVSVALLFVPTGFRKSTAGSLRARGVVLETDNSDVQEFGIIKQGDQGLTVEVLNTRFSGTQVRGNNILIGKMELDAFYTVGDKVLVTLELDGDGETIRHVNIVDHYRINVEIILLVLFILLLLVFAGWTGVRAIFSFVFTGLLIWKILLPGFLRGIDPVLLSLGIVLLMTGVIIFLVGGIGRKGFLAFLGSASGVIVTLLLSLLFGKLFHIHGAVKPFSETLLYSGFAHLNLTRIFLSGIFLASSGAVMDIAMDVSASMMEIAEKHPEISSRELMRSGFSVGRAVVGTMTTTLLLAYSGGYTAMLMVFMAQGTPVINMLNITYLSSEILHTLVGSFGLVTVAPFTALLGGTVLPGRHRRKRETDVPT